MTVHQGKRVADGFTLLELLIVVAILAAVAGAIIFSQGNMRATASAGLTRAEMQAIEDALLRFKQDTGHFPSPANPADFSALYTQGAESPWSVDSARGWRGPYLTRAGEGLVDIGDNLANTGAGDPSVIDSAARNEVRAVADPFVAWPIRNGGYARCSESDTDDACLLDWRTRSGDPRHPRWGRPYLLFDLDDKAKARLLSMGENGRYESGPCATDCASCAPSGDDIVLCLTR